MRLHKDITSGGDECVVHYIKREGVQAAHGYMC